MRTHNLLKAAAVAVVVVLPACDGFDDPLGPVEGRPEAVPAWFKYADEASTLFLREQEAMNEHDVSSGRGDYETVLRSIRQHALVVSVSSDILYPPAEQQKLADRLPNARYAVLDSDDGHDGFLIRTGRLARLIREFRDSLQAGTEGPSPRLVSAAPR